MFSRIFAFIAAMGSLAFAQTQYATTVKPLYADAKSEKVIGKLLPTAKVEVLKTDGKRVLISIEGFQEEAKPAIYFVAGKRILNAGFDGKAGVKFEKLDSQEIDEKIYNKVKVQVWTDNADLVNDVEALYAQAKDMYEQNCSMCHGLHPVKEFTANQWPSMFKAMAGRTGIEKKDYFLVIQYLQKNAKDMQ
ncbi:hypothetical protein [Helicobacter pametensis]|uniref:hypothetical protein n=1 Tax=Helicobacter pametensis TaxID=95149 RepID=UPI0004852D14|nr:hypothetical protein [Helicobacter pametensis]